MFLDHLVGGFAAHTGPHRRDEHLRRRQERQVAVKLSLDHRRVGTELRQHRQECFDLAVDGEERIGQRNPAHHRAEHVALIPLRPSKFRGPRSIATQHHLESIDAFAAAGVHLVWHGGGSDLSRGEALGGQFVAGHQPDGVRQRRRPGAELHQCRDHVVVQRARIHLAHAVEDRGEAEEFGHSPLEFGEPRSIAVKQVKHVLGGAHRALDTAQWIAVDEFADAAQGDERLLSRRGEPLAQCGGLRSDIVAAAGHHHIPVGRGPLRQSGRDSHPAGMHELQ